MKTCVAVMLLLLAGPALAQADPPWGPSAYPDSDAVAAWRALSASYVRKALKDHTVNVDPELNARVDAVMIAVGAAAGAIDARFVDVPWKAILIENFGRAAAAFPGETILLDAKFVRDLRLNDDELALVFSHEAAHVVAGHALAKLSFMAALVGKEKLPDARAALLEFLARDSYAAVFRPTARQQEREADSLGAAIFFLSGYDAQRALPLFDRLAELERREPGPGTHDAARVRQRAIAEVIAELQRSRAGRDPAPR